MPITDDVDIDNLFSSKKSRPIEELGSTDNYPKLDMTGMARKKRKKAVAKRRTVKRHCKHK